MGTFSSERLATLAAVVVTISSLARAGSWEPVPPMDWTKTKPADFADDELTIPYYLDHFHELANCVVEESGAEGPRGWFSKPFWRDVQFNHPWNARVLENYETLAYFYCTKRPWNVYYGSSAVRARLEAVLELWVSKQGPQGQFAEYGDNKWNLPATAFATKFMGRTLELLKDGPPIDVGLHKRVIEADRRAIMATFTLPQMYRDGLLVTNQFENVFGGAASYVAMFKDEEIDRLAREAMKKCLEEYQSPAGFLYENNSADFGYTLHTTHSAMAQSYNYNRGNEMGEMIEEQERKWTDWVSYNLLREPDGSTFFINRGIESRQTHMAWSRQTAPWGDKVELARAFAPSQEEVAADRKRRREKLVSEWGKPATPAGGDGAILLSGERERGGEERGHVAIEPYSFFVLAYDDRNPTAEQRDAAVAKLPYMARDRFVHQAVDSRFPLVCTYVRRPTYYAAFNGGTIRNPHQRYGLGILWSPEMGTVLQSQTKTAGEAWGTRLPESTGVCEAADLVPKLTLSGSELVPKPGSVDLPDGPVVATYPVGKGGEKTVTFGESISVKVRCAGAFVEQLPLLVTADPIVEGGRVRMPYGKGTVVISFDGGTARVRNTDVRRAGKRLVVVELPASDALSYALELRPAVAK